MTPYNEVLKSLCSDNAVEFVENHNGFLLASGEILDTLFYSDQIHINAAGTKKLLANFNRLHQIIRSSGEPSHKPPHYQNRPRAGFRPLKKGPPRSKPFRPLNQYCHICERFGGHNTQECWYNGWSNRFPSQTR